MTSNNYCCMALVSWAGEEVNSTTQKIAEKSFQQIMYILLKPLKFQANY